MEPAPSTAADEAPQQHAETVSQTEQAALLGLLERQLPVSSDPSLREIVNYHPRRNQRFHRWFKYREGYAPELVAAAIAERPTAPELVLDPFCGCGTTLFEARRSTIASVGVDINPVATLIARAKTRDYGANEVERLRTRTRDVLAVDPQSPLAPRPAIKILDQLFRPEILNALLAVRAVIDGEEDEILSEFLLAGWLAVLEDVSNVFKEGNGIKYRNRRRTAVGYHTVPWEQTKAYQGDPWVIVRGALRQQYDAMLDDVSVLPSGAEATVVLGTATDLSGVVSDDSVALSVFSPPYCNNFNYMKIFKVELWMGGFVKSYEDFRRLSASALRSHVETPLDLPETLGLPAELGEIVTWIGAADLWNRRIPHSVLAYFFDMKRVLEELHRALQPGGTCWLVVGNSAYAGVVVPTDLLLARIAEGVGLSVDRIDVARHLTTSSQQRGRLGELLHMLRESVLVLRKPQ